MSKYYTNFKDKSENVLIPIQLKEMRDDIVGKILWKNSDATRAIDDNYKIKLSNGNYDKLKIICCYSTSNIKKQMSFECIKGQDAILLIANPTSLFTLIGRTLTYNSDTEYTLSGAYLNQLNNNMVSSNNTGCIPLYVIGYNTKLFK